MSIRISKRVGLLLSAIAAALLQSHAAQAIVVNDTNFDLSDASNLGAPYGAVVSLFVSGSSNTGTGILIDSQHVLTARHVVEGASNQTSVLVDFNDTNNDRLDMSPPIGSGGTFIRSSNIYELTGPLSGTSSVDGYDLAIVKLDTPVTTIDPMRLMGGDMSYAVGKEATLVGFGNYGIGDAANFTNDGTWSERRAGTNVIDHYGSAAFPSGTASATENIFSTDFDDGAAEHNELDYLGSSATPLFYEATTAPGDSGGPLLVEYQGEQLVAGVLTAGTTSGLPYGDIGFWVGIGMHQDWIENTTGNTNLFVNVPEPSSLILMGLGGLCVLYRRRS